MGNTEREKVNNLIMITNFLFHTSSRTVLDHQLFTKFRIRHIRLDGIMK